MYDVITVGSATVDLFIKSDPEESEIISIKNKGKTQNILGFPLGSKILVSDLTEETGGGGTNTAVALSRLGLKAGFLGKIGSDLHGKIITSKLEKENVEFLGAIDEGKSGFSVILDSVKDDRTIFTFKGVNDSLDIKDVSTAQLAASWFYFSSMTGDAYKTLEVLADYAKKNKIRIVFNPSMYLAKKGMRFLKKLIEHCEIIILNKEEAEVLTKKIGVDKCLKDLKKLVPLVVITDGKNGAFACDAEFKYAIPARKIEVVETTGAGDAFASSFLAGMIMKRNIEFALQLGLANSESVVQNLGAKTGLLSLTKAVSEIREHPAIVKKTKL